jgi:hypothetical protein
MSGTIFLGLSRSAELDQFNTIATRLTRFQLRPYISLAVFNPVSGQTWSEKVCLKGIDRFQRDLERLGLQTFSSTRWRDVEKWIERRAQLPCRVS